MRLKNRGFMLMLLGVVLLLSVGEIRAAEFSADVVTVFEGKESRGKVYVKGNRMRQEFPSASSTPNILIYNSDTRVVWMLRPQQKMYLEMPLTEEMVRDLMQAAKDRTGMKPLGSETVNGYPADKYETVFRTNGGEQRHYIWIAKKLGMIIKIESLDKSFSRDYRDIKEGGVPEAVLNPPAGYRKMSLP